MQSTIKKLQKFDKKAIITATVTALLILALSLIITNKEGKRVEIATNQVASLSEKIRKYYSNKPDYWGLDTNQVISKNIDPQIIQEGGKLKNIFNTNILIGSDKDGAVVMPGSKSFGLTFSNLNKKTCIALATYKFEESKSLGLIRMTISNKDAEKIFTWGGEDELPILESKAKKACNSLNSIMWSYE